MGYSEIYCRICGVSFSIGRNRTPDEMEDKNASWYTRDGGYALGNENGGCGTEHGCIYYLLKTIPQQSGKHNLLVDLPFYHDDIPGNEDDSSSYVYESDSDDEPLEYNSDADDCSLEDDDDIQKESPMEIDDEVDDSDMEEELLYQEWLTAFEPQNLNKPLEVKKTMMSREKAKQHLNWTDDLHHLVGPKCRGGIGYNGNFITAQEMKGCTTAQCLIYKDENWTPSPDDEDFELEGKVFLSGLCDNVPSRDMDYPTVTPARHGIAKPMADNFIWDTPREYAMPFHPTCLEIYKRASRLPSNQATIHDLMKWRDIECSYEEVDEFPHDPAVKSCKEQWWQHVPGTEWLAANPVFIPALPSIFQSAISTNQNLSPDSPAFPNHLPKPRPRSSSRNTHDPFLNLSPELQDTILSYLPWDDIATLRLVSRAFTQLPQSLFRSLIQIEMPYLWELYDFAPPSFWTTVRASDLKLREEKRKTHNAELALLRQPIWEEMYDFYGEWRAAEPEFDEGIEGLKTGFEGLEGVEEGRADWCGLFLGVRRGIREGRLKGLENRRRIWRDVEEILRRVRRYRGMGWEVENGVEVV